MRAADGLCGRVCFDPAARGYYRLQLADGTVYQVLLTILYYAHQYLVLLLL